MAEAKAEVSSKKTEVKKTAPETVAKIKEYGKFSKRSTQSTLDKTP